MGEDMSKDAAPSKEEAAGERDASTGGQSAATPLFYRRPELLSAAAHGAWRVKPAGLGFAAQTNSTPIMAGEFAAAARHYPLVFAGPEHAPVAVLGLEQRNRFVRDDAWQRGVYVPAYVRRYPFVFARVNDPAGFALAIDAEAPMLVKDGEEGAALFEDGKPTEITRQALQFCEAFAREHAATCQFVESLAREKLLVERTADITLPQGRKTALAGFSVVDGESFARLPNAVVIEWHRKGWLALVYAHLASLACFTDLLAD